MTLITTKTRRYFQQNCLLILKNTLTDNSSQNTDEITVISNKDSLINSKHKRGSRRSEISLEFPEFIVILVTNNERSGRVKLYERVNVCVQVVLYGYRTKEIAPWFFIIFQAWSQKQMQILLNLR